MNTCALRLTWDWNSLQDHRCCLDAAVCCVVKTSFRGNRAAFGGGYEFNSRALFRTCEVHTHPALQTRDSMTFTKREPSQTKHRNTHLDPELCTHSSRTRLRPRTIRRCSLIGGTGMRRLPRVVEEEECWKQLADARARDERHSGHQVRGLLVGGGLPPLPAVCLAPHKALWMQKKSSPVVGARVSLKSPGLGTTNTDDLRPLLGPPARCSAGPRRTSAACGPAASRLRHKKSDVHLSAS